MKFFNRTTIVLLMASITMGFLAASSRANDPAMPSGYKMVASDDCGQAKRQANLRSGASWKMTRDERAGITATDPRLFTFNYGNTVVYRYAGLQENARYKVRILCLNIGHERKQEVTVDGRKMIADFDLPLGRLVTQVIDIPPELYRDSIIDIKFSKTGGFGALVSAIELWSDTPELRGPPGNLVRFRIDRLPPSGKVTISAALKIHYKPWNIEAQRFMPDGRIGARKLRANITHEQPGFTPWYDLRKFPYFGGQCAMMLDVTPGAEGQTQFAYYTNEAAFLRTIAWSEPDGLKISFRGFDSIRTFREHERENYFIALEQTGGRLFPLTRPPLLFANFWGRAGGAAADYMVKTLRLLGFNDVSAPPKYERLYGWGVQAGHYWPPLYFSGFWEIPDEATAAAMYNTYYRKWFAKKPNIGASLSSFQVCDEPGEQNFNNKPLADAAFREWAAARGLQPGLFGKKAWQDVALQDGSDNQLENKRLYYWSRKYKAYATPKMFALACAGVRAQAPAKDVRTFVVLSGHHLYMGGKTPLDMFQLAQYPDMTPGISDWMTTGGWWWDSHQSVAFSIALFNGGARQYGAHFGQPPLSLPMMHCVTPSPFRAYTQVANQCKLISYYAYGPSYEATEGYWSGNPWCHFAVQRVNNQAAQVDDILGPGRMRPSRVAMLYSMANEIWWPKSSFRDKRAAFLALSHDYFQPELVTEDQVATGALEHYDALYVLDSFVSRAAQERIGAWVGKGGLLWSCSEALVLDEYKEPCDLLERVAGLKRTFGKPVTGTALQVSSTDTAAAFETHTVPPDGRPQAITWEGARVRARYGDGVPAWLDKAVGRGRVVYLGHRCGLSYSLRAGKKGEFALWPSSGRSFLTQPLMEAGIVRELTISDPLIMAVPLSTEQGTVIVLHGMMPRPTSITLRLREPSRPHSVQWFGEGMDLAAVPFTYDGTSVVIQLSFVPWNGTMLVVRRTPAPADDRLAVMRRETEANLTATDWQALSAGAWFAGFFPQWELGPKLTPLLKHDNWAVRRSAAEAIGRLQFQAAGSALREAVETEKDTNVLADELLALARLKHPDIQKLLESHGASSDPFLQEELARVRALISSGPARTGKATP